MWFNPIREVQKNPVKLIYEINFSALLYIDLYSASEKKCQTI